MEYIAIFVSLIALAGMVVIHRRQGAILNWKPPTPPDPRAQGYVNSGDLRGAVNEGRKATLEEVDKKLDSFEIDLSGVLGKKATKAEFDSLKTLVRDPGDKATRIVNATKDPLAGTETSWPQGPTGVVDHEHPELDRKYERATDLAQDCLRQMEIVMGVLRSPLQAERDQLKADYLPKLTDMRLAKQAAERVYTPLRRKHMPERATDAMAEASVGSKENFASRAEHGAAMDRYIDETYPTELATHMQALTAAEEAYLEANAAFSSFRENSGVEPRLREIEEQLKAFEASEPKGEKGPRSRRSISPRRKKAKKVEQRAPRKPPPKRKQTETAPMEATAEAHPPPFPLAHAMGDQGDVEALEQDEYEVVTNPPASAPPQPTRVRDRERDYETLSDGDDEVPEPPDSLDLSILEPPTDGGYPFEEDVNEG